MPFNVYINCTSFSSKNHTGRLTAVCSNFRPVVGGGGGLWLGYRGCGAANEKYNHEDLYCVLYRQHVHMYLQAKHDLVSSTIAFVVGILLVVSTRTIQFRKRNTFLTTISMLERKFNQRPTIYLPNVRLVTIEFSLI